MQSTDSDTSSPPPPPISDSERVRELELQNTALRKEIRCKDVEYDKDKAVLTQQVTLLKQQISDATEREKSLRRMNETIFDTFTPDNKNCSKEMEMQVQLHEREVQELNESHRSAVDTYEKQLTEMRKNILDLEHNLKKTTEEKQSVVAEFKKQINELLLDKKSLDQKLKTFEGDKKQVRLTVRKDMDQLETGYQNKLEAQINLIERIKLEHAKETQKLKIESENALKDIKYIYDQEKMVLDGRMEKQNNTIKLLQMRKDSANTNNLSDLKTQYVEEIHDLNLQLETFKQHSMEELQATRQQKDNALQRVQELEQQVKRVADELDRERKTKQERGWNEFTKTMDDRNNENRLEVQNLKAEVKRLRSQERTLKRDISHREEQRNQEFKEMQNELHFEKKKTLEANLKQHQFDKRKEVILEEMVNKDEELKSVKKQHRVLEKEVERLQQIIQKHQICENKTKTLAVCSMPLQQQPKREASVSKLNNEVPPLDTSQALLYNQQPPPPSNRSLNRCHSQQSFIGNKCPACGEGKAVRMRGGNSAGGMRSSPPRSSTSMGRHHDSELSPMQIDQDSVAWRKVKAQEIKLLKTCQMMVDAASAMECSVCSSLYQTEQFLEHISSSSCFLDNYHNMQNPSLQVTQMNPGLHRAQSQGILRVSQNTPFEATATQNPLLFTPVSHAQMHNPELTHDMQNYHQVNISSLGDDLSAITGGEQIYQVQDRPLSPRDMLQSPHPNSFPVRASHGFSHFPQQNVAQFFPTQRSQPLSARSQASIVSQQVISPDMSHMLEHNRRLEEKLRDIELQLKEKENFLGDIKNQRDRQQLEYDKLNYELSQMRKENMVNQEKKSESENKLKHQISFLLERLLKTKNILAQTQEEKENLALTLQKQQQQIVASSPGNSTQENNISHSHHQSPSHVLLATPNIYNDEVSFSSQLSGGSHYQPPAANTRYQTRAPKHKSSSYLKKPEIAHSDSSEDHKVSGHEYSYYEQYSLLPVQRNNESHYNPTTNASMYHQHGAYSLHSTKARASSPNSIAKSLSTFVQNSPLKHRFNEKVGGAIHDSRVLPPSYNTSHRQTPSSPKATRKIPVSRKVQRASFQHESNMSSQGSPKRSKMYRSGSHRKGMTNIVQNMPHFTKKTIKDLNAHEDY